METRPPNNWRSFDNCLVVIEVAGLRILHWGDNRPNPPDNIWNRIDDIDIALLPADGSYHVLSPQQVKEVAERIKAKVIVPHHYYIWNVTTRGSTLLPPDVWVNRQEGARWLTGHSSSDYDADRSIRPTSASRTARSRSETPR
jgi:L-ascorbate metabolism protein UlaG (beta-lactamase superfamily)